MKLKLYQVALFLLPIQAIAQPTINSVEDYQLGTSVKYVNCRATTVAPGAAGANQHWMFNNMTPIDTVVDDVVNPAFTPYGNLHPNANVARKTKKGDYLYYNKTANATYLVAEHDQPANRHIVHNNTLLSSKRPLTFGNTATDTFTNRETTTNSNGTGIMNMTVDAYGMLHLPGNNNYLDVIRIKVQLASRDTIVNAPSPFPSPSYLTTVATMYAWFDNSHKSALLRWDSTAVLINNTTTPQTAKSVAYFLDEYPNDVKTMLPEQIATTANISGQTLVLNGDFNYGKTYEVNVFNLNGQRIQDFNFASGSKIQSLTLNTELAAGMYVILVRSDVSAMPDIIKALKQ